jgi:hypothetical protein
MVKDARVTAEDEQTGRPGMTTHERYLEMQAAMQPGECELCEASWPVRCTEHAIEDWLKAPVPVGLPGYQLISN